MAPATEAAAAVAVVLVVLLLLEVLHIGGWYDDAQQALDANGLAATVSGTPGFGLWLALIAAVVIAFGAVRAMLATRRSA